LVREARRAAQRAKAEGVIRHWPLRWTGAYIGDTRSVALRAELRRHGGIMVIRGRLMRNRPWEHRIRWAYDNGAWMDHVRGAAFDADAWQRELELIARLPTRDAPDFCVLPDIVAGGHASLDLSLSWLPRVRGVHWHWYLPVQDGVELADIPEELPDWCAGIFVGGSTAWKLRTARIWSEAAHRRGMMCHVGRVGSVRRLRHMKSLGIDTIDSALPLFSAAKWKRFWAELESGQTTLGV
jgi:hypothetical protein